MSGRGAATVGAVSVTEDAPAAPAARAPADFSPGRVRRPSPWWALVGGSALVLVLVALVLGGWWAASRETRITSYRVIGTLTAVELELDAAAVEVVGGGGGAVDVRRTDGFAFGRPPTEERAVEGGVLRIGSRCPDIVLGTCETSYRIAVPDNVQVNVRTTSGPVRISGLNASARIATESAPITVDGFCGFSLTATSAGGDVRASTDCSADRLEVRSGSGRVHATVPSSRYTVEAESATGVERVRGIIVAPDAAFHIQAISGGDDVIVEGAR
jgi:Putative adhesin